MASKFVDNSLTGVERSDQFDSGELYNCKQFHSDYSDEEDCEDDILNDFYSDEAAGISTLFTFTFYFDKVCR